jgi:gluconate kinase
MSLYLLTGVAGSGKTTIMNELRRIGYETHDADEEEIAADYNKQTGERVRRPDDPHDRTTAWYAKYEWRMSEAVVKHLRLGARRKPVFVAGIAYNFLDIIPYFDSIFCLTADWPTLHKRLKMRSKVSFGQNDLERESVRTSFKEFERLNTEHGSILIDATQPISVTVKQITAQIRVIYT